MANEENLKPLNTLAKDKQREIQRKGGQARAKQRREAKQIKYYIDLLLSKPLKEEKLKARLEQAGVDTEDIDNKMAMVYMQWIEAGKGNTKAFENLLNYAGEKPIDQVQNINPPIITIERPDK